MFYIIHPRPPECSARCRYPAVKLAELHNYQPSSDNRGDEIGNREGEPYAVDSKLARQKYQQRNQEHHLSQQAYDYRLGGFTNTLEERCGYHLKAHDGEDYQTQAQGALRSVEKGAVGGKGHAYLAWESEAESRSAGSDDGRGRYSKHICAAEAVVVAGAVIIADNRLQALADTEHYCHQKRGICHHYAGSTDIAVAAVAQKGVVGKGIDDTRGGIYYRRGGADGYNTAYYGPVEPPYTAGEAHRGVAAHEVYHHEYR